MLRHGIGRRLGRNSGSGGAASIIASGFALYGDSMAEGSSGGGSPTAYNAFGPTLARKFLDGGETIDIYNFAVGGESSTQAAARFLARTTFCRRNLFWMGRNDIAVPATVIANIASCVADLREGETFTVLSVHNFNNNTEPSGSADYIKIMQINDALAAAYPTQYVDSRAEMVFARAQGNATDDTNFTRDEPATSLCADTIHPNATGYDLTANQVWNNFFTRELPVTGYLDLVTNGTFAGGNATGWTLGNGAATTFPSGACKWTGDGANGYPAFQQQFVASGATGKKYILVYDLVDLTIPVSTKLRAYIGGGTAYANTDFGTKRASHNLTLGITATDVAIGLSFEGINFATASMTLDNIRFYEVG